MFSLDKLFGTLVPTQNNPYALGGGAAPQLGMNAPRPPGLLEEGQYALPSQPAQLGTMPQGPALGMNQPMQAPQRVDVAALRQRGAALQKLGGQKAPPQAVQAPAGVPVGQPGRGGPIDFRQFGYGRPRRM